MIAELRATQLEADNRRHFTAEKQPIQLARTFVDEATTPGPTPDPQLMAAKTATNLRLAAEADLFEVG